MLRKSLYLSFLLLVPQFLYQASAQQSINETQTFNDNYTIEYYNYNATDGRRLHVTLRYSGLNITDLQANNSTIGYFLGIGFNLSSSNNTN